MLHDADMQGGTAAAPYQLNNKNLAHPATYWNDTSDCHYLVALQDTNSVPAGRLLSPFEKGPLFQATVQGHTSRRSGSIRHAWVTVPFVTLGANSICHPLGAATSPCAGLVLAW